MHNIFRKIISCFIGVAFAISTFVSCSQGSNSYLNNDSSHIQNETDILIDGFDREEDTFLFSVNNDIKTFSFLSKVTVAKGSEWKLYEDIGGKQEIVTKTINLISGDNYSYIFVSTSKGKQALYTIKIRRLPLYKVTFSTIDGEKIQDQFVQEGSLVSEVPNPSRTGYTFIKWNYDFAKPVYSDLTITATWKAKSYVIQLDTNGGDPLSVSSFAIEYNETIHLPTPSRRGFTFRGWRYGNSFIVDGTMWRIDSDAVLKAMWEGNIYHITYLAGAGRIEDPNSSTGYSEVTDEVRFGENYVVRNAHLTGYYLEGWHRGPADDYAKLESGIWSIDSDVIVNARWEPQEFTIFYDDNGGDETNLKTQIVKYKQNYELVVPTKKGYTFEGWFDGDRQFVSGVWDYLQDKTLKAKWTPTTYSIFLSHPSSITHYYVTFDYKGGKSSDESNVKEVVVGTPVEIPSKPTKKGYVFRGWFTDEDCRKYFDFTSKITESMTLYAGWYEIASESGTTIRLNNPNGIGALVTAGTTVYYYFVVPATQKYILTCEYKTSNNDLEKGLIMYNVTSFCSGNVNISKTFGYENDGYAYDKIQTIEFDGIAGSVIRIQYTEVYGSKNDPETYGVFTSISGDEPPVNSSDLSIEAIPLPVSVTFDSDFNLGVPTYPGHTFIGWFSEPNGNGERLTDETGASLAPWSYDTIQYVYAFFR